MNCGSSVTYSQNENHIPMISNNSTPVQGTNTTINLESSPHDVQEPFDFDDATKEINDKLQTDIERCNDKNIEVSEDECALGQDVRECVTKDINDKVQTDIEKCNDKNKEVSEDKCALGHDMRECDPVYDGHYAMSYYNDLWGGLTCVRADCPYAGLSFGEMIKKKVKVHYCKLCENYEGHKRCNHVICDLCKTKDEDSMGGNRRSRRMRN